jgi:hypothetical protein
MSVEKGSNASTEEMIQDIAEARFICKKEIKNAQMLTLKISEKNTGRSFGNS